MSVLELKNVDMCFKGFKGADLKVLNNINLAVEEGQIIALVGESGCGKTTIGKIMNDIYKPTNGDVYFYGKPLKEIRKNKKLYKEYRMSVQMVHQDSYAALNPNKTIFDSMSLPIIAHKMRKTKEEIINLLVEKMTEVGLVPAWQFLRKFPHQLSGGQRQRILLARALLFNPKVIVADEPVSMVDVSLRIMLLNLMSKINQKYKVSFVYITHDLATARYIARDGKIAVMYLGDLVEYNDIEKALDEPKHPYFHALLAAVPNPIKNTSYENLPLKSIEMPNLYDLPKGCKFNTRCPHADERCETESCSLRNLNGGLVACHKAEDIKFSFRE